MAGNGRGRRALLTPGICSSLPIADAPLGRPTTRVFSIDARTAMTCFLAAGLEHRATGLDRFRQGFRQNPRAYPRHGHNNMRINLMTASQLPRTSSLSDPRPGNHGWAPRSGLPSIRESAQLRHVHDGRVIVTVGKCSTSPRSRTLAAPPAGRLTTLSISS